MRSLGPQDGRSVVRAERSIAGHGADGGILENRFDHD
jgi:hypothetical protein